MKFYESEISSERTATRLYKSIIYYTKLEAFVEAKGVLKTEITKKKCRKDQEV